MSLYFLDGKCRHRPHVHVRYQDDEAVIALPEGEVLEGGLPPGKMKLVVMDRAAQGRIGSRLAARGERATALQD